MITLIQLDLFCYFINFQIFKVINNTLLKLIFNIFLDDLYYFLSLFKKIDFMKIIQKIIIIRISVK